MNTKKSYMVPLIEVINLEVESVIAGSIQITENEIEGIARSRKRFWSSDEE